MGNKSKKYRRMPKSEEIKDSLDEIRAAIDSIAAQLTIPHKRFADEYLANGNVGVKAYLLIFNTENYKAAASGAWKLLNRPDVKAYVDLCKQYTTDEVLNHLTITKDRVMDEEAQLAFIDIRKMFDPEGTFLPPQHWPEEIARAVSGVDIDQTWDVKTDTWKYKYKIKLNDKGRALQRLETVLGMNKAAELSDKDADLFKGFLQSIDGDSRGTLPSELEEDQE